MYSIITFLKKNLTFSNFWIRNEISLFIIALVANHLTEEENFPLNDDYRFPWYGIFASMMVGSVILIISYFNFKHFKSKYFSTKINTQTLLRFLFSTLGYIVLAYVLLYFILIGAVDADYNLYGFLTGISLTLLVSSIGISAAFAKDIYELHKMESISGKLNVQQGGKITLVNYSEISFIYSENKIVYIAKIDGTSIITDFTLNDIESKLSEQSFFRANRQTILHARSIEQVQSIENGKLSVLLKPTLPGKHAFQITISRYKKQTFMNWFQGKL